VSTEHEHDPTRGRYSEGQEDEPDEGEKEHLGDFAEGRGPHRSPPLGDEGDFAEGQEQRPDEHEGGLTGDFARGQDEDA
jgi:hypothetical protein